jgi:hypothetical protein
VSLDSYRCGMKVRKPQGAIGDDDSDRVFILRFWRERAASADGRAFWRAKVTEPDGGAARHANSVDEALALVRNAMCGASANGGTPVS